MTTVRGSLKRKRRSLTPFSPTPTTTKGSPLTEPRGGFRRQTRGRPVVGEPWAVAACEEVERCALLEPGMRRWGLGFAPFCRNC
ncbi:hypothetical protein E1A91_D02G128000v1 [Gossypium mustelinum]|uniref:Uncharacterized protein n=1 Tax=Gossypium mustelinum TaxID=34275 RepID=A0A5D2VUX9_GOSMU|nr:hypothetical protein E1A91_D02G128000v1 [Gossypium mustelinum]